MHTVRMENKKEREVLQMFTKLGVVFICVVLLSVFSITPLKAQNSPSQQQEDVKAADTKLKELNKKMDELAAETRKATGETRAEMNRLYEEFKKQQEKAAGELEELRKSTNETWDKAKVKMDKALENLNGLYERSKAKVKGKDETK
jgi:biopolymer transport protein ExbB/TolQ